MPVFTYSGHPVGGAVGLANLDIMEREGLVENSAAMGAYLRDRLRERLADNPFVGDIRGVGLMVAVEFVADKKSRRFFDPFVGLVGRRGVGGTAARASIAASFARQSSRFRPWSRYLRNCANTGATNSRAAPWCAESKSSWRSAVCTVSNFFRFASVACESPWRAASMVLKIRSVTPAMAEITATIA